MDGRTDRPSYRDARMHLVNHCCTEGIFSRGLATLDLAVSVGWLVGQLVVRSVGLLISR